TSGGSPSMDRIAAMNAFVRVVEAGTFTRAAETLNLPNATVTRLIQALEQDLKVKLLHRTTRSVTVTPEGATYFERVQRLLADLSDIESSTRSARGKPSGRVRVESAPAIGTRVILPALPQFYAEYPDIEVELGVGNWRTDLVAEGVDCTLRAGDVEEQSLVARRIGSFDFTTCAAPAYLHAHGTPALPDDLASHHTIGLVSARTGRALPFRFLHEDGETQPELAHRLQVKDTNSYVEAALAGLGVVQAPTYAVRDALAQHRLEPLLAGWHTPVIPVHVLYAQNRYLSAKVRVFIDWVVALFGQDQGLQLASRRGLEGLPTRGN
ncbi:MAG TPA: LysR family transcriptional regulator, partial [Burkholderiaceae bacterium]|nr:LysR family transcriptional regulator [Burkholderiaceae bacterium]